LSASVRPDVRRVRPLVRRLGDGDRDDEDEANDGGDSKIMAI
jgi:hypothetical protein